MRATHQAKFGIQPVLFPTDTDGSLTRPPDTACQSLPITGKVHAFSDRRHEVEHRSPVPPSPAFEATARGVQFRDRIAVVVESPPQAIFRAFHEVTLRDMKFAWLLGEIRYLRLISRIGPAVHFIMQRKQLLGVRRRAESTRADTLVSADRPPKVDRDAA
jgi:hypothetical protein